MLLADATNTFIWSDGWLDRLPMTHHIRRQQCKHLCMMALIRMEKKKRAAP